MTEQEWLACEEPILLLRHLDPEPYCRPALLLTCACLLRRGPLPEAGRAWIEAAGSLAEGLGVVDDLPEESAESALYDLEGESDESGALLAALDLFSVRWRAPEWTQGEPPEPYMVEAYLAECREQARLVRDVFGNPFRPVTVEPTWQTPTVVQLARAAYDERELPLGHLDSARLAVLADALEAAGATGEIVAHLRSPGPHVRGCWALDLVLGKT